jgi:DNA gyrase subunit A
MVITASGTGYIKRTSLSTYRSQRRGGKGRIGMSIREEDAVGHLFVASTHSYIMIFSDRGRAYWLKVHEIPVVAPDGRGTPIVNLASMEPGERIAALLAVREWPAEDDRAYVLMATRKGVVKKTDLRAFSNPRSGGIIAIGVDPDDAVIGVQLTDGSSEILLGTRGGMAIRFEEADVRPMGRTAYGVRGISLRDDEVVAMVVLRPAGTILTVTENGYGKRTDIEEYRVQSRGGLGIINIQTTERNGRVVGLACVTEDDEVMLVTEAGKILRTGVADVRIIGRATQGVRMIEIDEGDRVVSLARFAGRDAADEPDQEETADARVEERSE